MWRKGFYYLTMSDAITQLRMIRNGLLRDTNDEILKYLAKGESIPTDLATYMQQLRDLPANSTPTLDETGSIDESSYTLPTMPTWWKEKLGLD